MRLMYKKFTWKDGFKNGIVGLGIMLRTFSNKVHVEFDFEAPVGTDGENCFSASGMDNTVRWKKINFSHPGRWVEQKLNNNAQTVIAKTVKKANSINGQNYDFTAIFLKEFIPLGLQNPENWYCSETCAWLCQLNKVCISPGKLYRKVKKLIVKGRLVPLS